MTEIIKKIQDAGVIALASSNEKADSMIGAGVGALLTSSLEVIRHIKASRPELAVGYCGDEEADAAAAAGADFLYGEFFCPKCTARAKDNGLVSVAVAKSAEQAAKMHEIGADIIALEDADAMGGVAMLGALSTASPDAKYIVCGANTPLDYTVIPACIGWVDTEIDTAEDTAAAASAAMYASLGLTLAHIGINAECEQSAIEISTAYSKLLGIKQKTGNSSCFAGSWVEVMKTPYLGEHGHIAIGTKSLVRAIAFYERIGVKFNMSTAKPVAIYFAEDIGGFAIHLVQK